MDINENVRIKPIYNDVLSESAYFKKGYNGDGSMLLLDYFYSGLE